MVCVVAGTQFGCETPSRSKAGTYRKEITMRDEEAAPATKGVTVKLLSALDLGPEIEGMAGRQLRMRMVTIEPGGVFGPIHDHRRGVGRERKGHDQEIGLSVEDE